MASRKSPRYWQNQDNFERKVKEAIELNDGNRPTKTWLSKNGYGGLAGAAQNHYGGFRNVLDRVMGEESGNKPHRYWPVWDNFEREAREAIELNDGNRPTNKWLYENGYSSLVSAARTYHGGFTNALDRVIGKESGRKPRGYWQNQDNFERGAREAIELNDGNRPTGKWLNKNGYSSLVRAAQKHYDGLPNVLDRIMGEETEKIKPSGYWKDWDNVERVAKEAIELNDGNRPTQRWLHKNGYGGLVDAARKYHGGLTNVLDRFMGAEPDNLELFLKGYVDGGNGDGK